LNDAVDHLLVKLLFSALFSALPIGRALSSATSKQLVLKRIRKLQKQASVADHFVPRRKPIGNLRLPALAQPD
jgi:hypothetical protein